MSSVVETRAQEGRRFSIAPFIQALVRDIRRHSILYLMALPGILYFLIFRYYPMYWLAG